MIELPGISHAGALFLGLRKEWQGFKNKIIDTGEIMFKLDPESDSRPGNAICGPVNIKSGKVNSSWLPCKNGQDLTVFSHFFKK